jgi:ABC-type phosphate transport system substrate-binding protein
MKGIRLLARTALLLAVAVPGLAQNVQIDGAGATFPFPIYSKWFSEYNKLHPRSRSTTSRSDRAAESGSSRTRRSSSARPTAR